MQRTDSDNWFERSETYKEMNRLMDMETPFSDEVGDDEFIAGFMRPDIKFKSEADELKLLLTS